MTKEETTTTDEALQLAEENTRLAEENRQLKLAEQRHSVELFLSELRKNGQLTPAIELAGIESALVCADNTQGVVEIGDGSSAPLGAVLRDICSALPVSVHLGEVARGAESPPATLSDDEKRIAGQLGISEEEFSEIRAGS